MRLIDADTLIKDLDYLYTKSHVPVDMRARITLSTVMEQSTAYDVDKVVKQLEDERGLSYSDFNKYVEEVSPCLDAEYDDSFQRGLERAIKIIKAGKING